MCPSSWITFTAKLLYAPSISMTTETWHALMTASVNRINYVGLCLKDNELMMWTSYILRRWCRFSKFQGKTSWKTWWRRTCVEGNWRCHQQNLQRANWNTLGLATSVNISILQYSGSIRRRRIKLVPIDCPPYKSTRNYTKTKVLVTVPHICNINCRYTEYHPSE